MQKLWALVRVMEIILNLFLNELPRNSIHAYDSRQFTITLGNQFTKLCFNSRKLQRRIAQQFNSRLQQQAIHDCPRQSIHKTKSFNSRKLQIFISSPTGTKPRSQFTPRNTHFLARRYLIMSYNFYFAMLWCHLFISKSEHLFVSKYYLFLKYDNRMPLFKHFLPFFWQNSLFWIVFFPFLFSISFAISPQKPSFFAQKKPLFFGFLSFLLHSSLFTFNRFPLLNFTMPKKEQIFFYSYDTP